MSSKTSSWRQRIDPVVFYLTAAIAIAFIAWGVISAESLGTASGSAQEWVITNTGWFFVLSSTCFVIFVIWLAASKYGRIPLGEDGEKPEFKTISWIAMMFSAGMGIGLMFWGVAEPLSHFVSPPPGTTEAQSEQAFQTAMATTMFHWGLHPWAIYAVVGIAIAYGTFRKGRSHLISAAFRPLIGARADGPVGRVIDMLAIFATLFGSAASLGLGALQIGSGIEFNGWVDSIGKGVLVAVIAVLTVAFIASAVSGIAKGIQWLANINMVLALVLAAFVFIAGPTLLILNLLPTTLGDYATQMGAMASRTAATGGDGMTDWLAGWTIFYWAWWVSWTPFVGMFIARISRGRTIRQFVTGVLLVPSLVSLVWFAVFGGTAIDIQRTTGKLVDSAGAVNTDSALFQVLGELPLTGITTVLVMVLVGIFFVSGADAASVVMGTLSERGSIEPSRRTVVFWGSVMGAVAAIMLVIGSQDALDEALTGLQQVTIVAAVPFAVIMAALCVALWKDLQNDPLVVHGRLGEEMVAGAVMTGVEEHDGDFVLVVEPTEAVEAIEAGEPVEPVEAGKA